MASSTIDVALQTNERIARLVSNLEEIATLPEVAARIIQIVNDPDSSAADLHRVVANDPSLVSRILKLVNSAYYARAVEIRSIERAITLLGFDAVQRVALAASMGQLFPSRSICQGFTAKDLWTHCVAVAAASRALAKQFNPDLAEEVFLAGLMHDVGMLVALQVCPEKLAEVCDRSRTDVARFTMIELGVIGVDHQELGAALARQWGFPQACWAVARYHHSPALADYPWNTLAAIVNVADILCCQAGIGFSLTAIHELSDAPAFQGLLPFGAIEAVSQNLRTIVQPSLSVLL